MGTSTKTGRCESICTGLGPKHLDSKGDHGRDCAEVWVSDRPGCGEPARDAAGDRFWDHGLQCVGLAVSAGESYPVPTDVLSMGTWTTMRCSATVVVAKK